MASVKTEQHQYNNIHPIMLLLRTVHQETKYWNTCIS